MSISISILCVCVCVYGYVYINMPDRCTTKHSWWAVSPDPVAISWYISRLTLTCSYMFYNALHRDVCIY